MSASVPDRQTRRRTATRRKLIDAAKALFARQGVDNTRIQEITDEADVGFGSFYNHFENKQAIVEAVLVEVLSGQAATIEVVTQELEDPAEVIAAAHRYFVRLARTDPEWAWLLIRFDLSHDIGLRALGPFARRDLRRGIEQGRLSVPDEDVTLSACGGAMLAVMRSVLDGRLPEDADMLHAECVLRILGLAADDAAEVARRPLPRELPI